MEFHVLGPLEVLRESEVVELGHAKQRAVLGVLILHRGEVVSTERLIDELWGESPPPTATKAVQVYISRLRKALGDAAATLVRTQAPGYVFHSESNAVDADRFESLVAQARRERESGDLDGAGAGYREGLALWRGRALGDLAFESFAANEAERLNEQRLEALTERIDCDLQLGRHGELVGELEALVAEHPLRESLRGPLMLALYRSGRQADALEAYVDARRTLRDELGLEPSPELRRLEQEILRHDDALQPAEPQFARLNAITDAAPVQHPASPRRSRRTIGIVGLCGVSVVVAAAIVTATRPGPRDFRAAPNSVVRIDRATGRASSAAATVGVPGAVAVGGGSVWVANGRDGTISRLSSRSGREIAVVPIQTQPTALAFAHHSLWVATGRANQLLKVDPTYNRVEQTLQLEPGGVSQWKPPPVTAVAASNSGVWVGAPRVQKFDVDGQRTISPTYFGVAGGLATAANSVWATLPGDGLLVQLGPDSHVVQQIRVGGQTESGVAQVNGVTGITSCHGSLWLAEPGGSHVWQIDPVSVRIINSTAVPGNPTFVACSAGGLWVASVTNGTITEIDTNTARVERSIHIGGTPAGIAADERSVWVSVD